MREIVTLIIEDVI